jgi:hypothetical protein
MTNTYSTEAQLLQNTPKQFPIFIGRIKRFRNRIKLTGQLVADTVTFLIVCFGVLNGPTLGSSTIAISDGTNTYLAAQTFTAGVSTMFGATGPENLDSVPAPTQVAYTPVLTIAGATMPTAGILTVDMYVSQPD